MSAEQFQLVVGLFEQACSLSGAARAEFLDKQCGDDLELRRQVERMLAHDAQSLGPMAAGGGVGVLAAGLARAERVRHMTDHPEASKASGTPPVLSGSYRILRIIGEGGMGVVYEAEQVRPRRIVALKAIRRGMTSRQMLKRFEHEAHILGRLNHPGIAKIYEAGAADEMQPDQAYFAMEFVSGKTVTEYAAARNLSVRERLTLLIKLCDAVQHAHQRGVIHRDLKPSNILVVEESAQPKILDFGVAHELSEDPQVTTMHTAAGQVIGTLSYMSPEQAAGNLADMDTRSDVYALGVLGYQLLSGRLPLELDQQSFLEAARMIREQEPPPLGTMDSVFRGDIQTIFAKALEKDKERRYESAAAMGEDIRRHLADLPISALPPSSMYQLRKFARRHKVLVGAAAIVGLVCIAALAAISAFAINAKSARDKAVLSEKAQINLRHIAETNAASARRQAYRANIGAADSALQVHDLSLARQRLDAVDQADQANWEWRHYRSLLDDSVASFNVRTVAFTVEFTPDGQRLIVGLWNGLKMLDLRSDAPEVTNFPGHTAQVRAVACTRDGTMIASASNDQTVRLWDAQTARPLRTLEGHAGKVLTVAFSRDGKWLASGGDDRIVRLWNAQDGAPLATFTGHGGDINCIAFSPDDSMVASASADGTVRLWDFATGEQVMRLEHGDDVWCLAFNPDGSLIATAAEDKAIRLWNVKNASQVQVMRGHTSRLNALRFSNDGRLLASTSMDHTLRLWRVDSGIEAAVLCGHTQSVFGLAWSADGSRIATSSSDGTVRLWDPAVTDDVDVLRGHLGAVSAVAFTRDGTKMVSVSLDGTVRLWDAASALPLDVLQKHGQRIFDLAMSRDGAHVACACADHVVRVFKLETGELEATLTGHEDMVMCVTFAPDGKHIASGSDDRTIRIWDLSSRGEIQKLIGHEARIGSVAFSDYARRIVSASDDGTARLWSTDTGESLHIMKGHKGPVYGAVFTLDGRSIVSGGFDQTLRWWNAMTGEPLPQSLSRVNGVGHIAFNPDGTRLVIGTPEGAIRMFDTASLEEVALLRGHTYAVTCPVFSPDGSRLASASVDRTIRLWETEPTSVRLQARRTAQQSTLR